MNKLQFRKSDFEDNYVLSFYFGVFFYFILKDKFEMKYPFPPPIIGDDDRTIIVRMERIGVESWIELQNNLGTKEQ